MKPKHIIGVLLGALAYLTQGFVTGYLFLNTAYAKYSNPGLSKGLDIELWLIVVASLLISLLYVYIFSNWKNGITAGSGAASGAIIFLLAGGAFDIATYASTNLYNSSLIILNSAVGSLIGGAAVGGVIGWWLNRK